MANEITSQITSTVQNRSRLAESVERPATGPVEAASNRQDVAASNVVQADDAIEQDSQNVGVPSRALLEQAVSDINTYVQSVNRELQFRVDEALPLGRSVVTVIDSDTDETIREFPSEQALALAHRLQEAGDEFQQDVEGLIFSARV